MAIKIQHHFIPGENAIELPNSPNDYDLVSAYARCAAPEGDSGSQVVEGAKLLGAGFGGEPGAEKPAVFFAYDGAEIDAVVVVDGL